jgi:glycerol-3-phosphate acyltransferase PlsY
LTLAAYLAGSIPTSHWVSRGIYGKDLRREGSGNLGATNVFRVLGWRAALPVLVVDIVKGWAPAALFPLVTPGASPAWAVAYGAAAIAGHVSSFWVGFKGGKGVATSCGVFLALAPWAALIGVGIWAAAVFTTGYVSVGSILAAIALPAAIFFTPYRGGPLLPAFAASLGLFIIWAHRGNIQRLLKGEERRFGRRAG